jgi:hypothetical protein
MQFNVVDCFFCDGRKYYIIKVNGQYFEVADHRKGFKHVL